MFRCALSVGNYFINKVSTFAKTVCVRLKMPYYAVANGRGGTGIFNTWAECEARVKGFKGAKYKKFNTVDEAQRFTGTLSIAPAPVTPPIVTMHSPTPVLTSRTIIRKKTNTATSKNNTDDWSNNNLHEEIMKKMDEIEEDLKVIKKNTVSGGKNKAVMIEALPMSSETLPSASLKRPAEDVNTMQTSTKKLKTLSVIKGQDKYNFNVDETGFVEVYTDGSCSNNGFKGAQAGLGVYFGNDHPLNVSDPVSGRATNNCGEIQAATKAIRIVHSLGINKLNIKTDSKFVINSMTKWVQNWKRKGWKLANGEPVKNEVDFKDLDSALKLVSVRWEYVNAHKGIHGNEMADKLAKAGATKYKK